MPRDGSRILSDLQSPTVSIVYEPCGQREDYPVAKLIDEHGAEAKLTDLLDAGRVGSGMPDKVLGDLPLRRMMRLRPDIRQRSDYRTPRQRPDLLIDELKPAILDLSLHRQSDGGTRGGHNGSCTGYRGK